MAEELKDEAALLYMAIDLRIGQDEQDLQDSSDENGDRHHK